MACHCGRVHGSNQEACSPKLAVTRIRFLQLSQYAHLDR
ncbi:hypothetical protein PVAP13_1KG246733 [Panicum virgatum]|uniref:Uncharacterized protein n=1 Tax=Panicum virgatum TaxID=38727 RepID=A0A8T0XFF9_PANVG|nr:hypothetical protein PVAP13_1KG246733 [Panicum virgatum]